MKFECYLAEGHDIDIHPAVRRREWMDETSEAFAYRCLPLSIANSHGWEIRSPVAVEAEWNGGNQANDVTAYIDGPPAKYAAGHFGSGILTFRPGAIFRTPPGYNLYVTGPVNSFKDAIQPLSGVIETDWIPFPFTMNWKFTRPNIRVRFERGEPFCVVFPIKRRVLEEFDPRILDISSDQELQKQFEYAKNRRTFKAGLQLLGARIPEENRPRDLDFQRWYLQGTLPDQSATFEGHQKVLTLKSFRREGDAASAPPADDVPTPPVSS